MSYSCTPVYGNGWTDLVSEGALEVPQPFTIINLEPNGIWETGTINSPSHDFDSLFASVIVRFHDRATGYKIYDVVISKSIGDPDEINEDVLFVGAGLLERN